jgi:NADPH-dependent F420 reductase
MSTSTKIAIIGAGNVGGGLGVRFAQSGFSVKFGVRDAKDNEALRKECGPNASIATPAEAAAWGDVVFLALPGSVALEVAKSLAEQLEGKVVVDCNNALVWKEGPVWNPPPEGSLTQAIAKAVPGAKLVKGWNTFGAEFHKDPTFAGAPPVQVFLASDDADAKKLLAEIATKAGYRTVDAGPLRNAPVLENLAILWIHLALVGGQGRSFAFAMQKRG